MTAFTGTTEPAATADTDRDQSDPRWARSALSVLLIATAAFWCIGLGRNGWANAFYSAAVQAGTKSWKAFLFGSSDAANAITVDKPPAALWPMEISARIFGVNTWSILLPQVLLGVASVALLYVIVKKHFGPGAGLIAGVTLTLTPVATLMFRFNNPEALLVFLMIAAVWALLRSVDDGRTRWIVLCGALIGLGFLTKQLQVLLVLPALALTYLIAGPPRLGVRVLQLLAGLAAMIAAAGWWVLLVELWPKDSRPYIGGSQNNSFLDLTFGYNGLGRLKGGDTNFPGAPPPDLPGGFSPFGHAGITRMFTGESGGQISWLLPAALTLLVAGLMVCGRRPRTDAQRAQFLVWGGWLVGT
ncbi:glycosyltransferase family 39 protein, partial [Mycobacterium sp. TNTM28]